MSIEQNVETTVQFIEVWRQRPDRLLPELTSLHNETNRKPDTYYLEVNNGELIDPETQKPVREFIDTTTYLGRTEAEIAEKIGKWAEENEEGLAFWVSPPYPDRYPCAKIIIHRIAYTWEGQKIINNAAILFEAEGEDLAEILPTGDQNPEELRKTLFVSRDEEEVLLEIQAKLEKYSRPAKNLTPQELTYQAEIFAEMISRGISPQTIAGQMRTMGFLGAESISCPPTLSEFISSKVTSETGKFVRRCGNCGADINTVIAKGYRCPNCNGVYEGC